MKREMVHKLAMAVAAAFVGLLLLADAQAQTPISRDAVVLSSGDTGRFDNTIGSGLTKFEYNVTGTPATASIVLKGCMRGGTCDTLQTDTNTTDTMRLISGLWDYMTIVPTFTGGTAPKVSVKMTSITRSPMGQSFGVVASTSGGASNVNLAQVGGTNTVTGGVAGSVGVGGLAANAAAAAGNPVRMGGIDASGNIETVAVSTVGVPSMGNAITGADGFNNASMARVITDAGNQSGLYGILPHVFNGATWDRARGNTFGAFMQGNAGNGAAPVGNPLFIATDGVKQWALATIGGCAGTSFGCPLALGANGTGADAVSNTLILYPSSSGSTAAQLWAGANHIFNGTSWDRGRSVINGQDTAGAGVSAVGDLCQLDETSTGTVTENQWGPCRIDSRRLLYVRTTAPTPINCVVPVSTATTIQAVAAGCAAPGAGLSIYITDIEFGSSAASGTAADSFPTLKSGTGGTCGTATAVIWQALTAANTTQIANLSQPIKVAVNSEVCWIMSTAGSKTIQIHGFIAP
jgi:hypothetical protein